MDQEFGGRVSIDLEDSNYYEDVSLEAMREAAKVWCERECVEIAIDHRLGNAFARVIEGYRKKMVRNYWIGVACGSVGIVVFNFLLLVIMSLLS